MKSNQPKKNLWKNKKVQDKMISRAKSVNRKEVICYSKYEITLFYLLFKKWKLTLCFNDHIVNSSPYFINFRFKTLEKNMSSFIIQSIDYKVPIQFYSIALASNNPRRLLYHLLNHPNQTASCPVSWGCRIHRLHLCRGVRTPTPISVLVMTLNNLMVRFQ